MILKALLSLLGGLFGATGKWIGGKLFKKAPAPPSVPIEVVNDINKVTAENHRQNVDQLEKKIEQANVEHDASIESVRVSTTDESKREAIRRRTKAINKRNQSSD